MTSWDWLLIVGVATMGTAVAYLRHPQHKANVMMLPVPFTLAALSVGKPIDATNALAMPVLFGFTIVVWALHARQRVPMLAAIVVAAVYCLIGAGIARWQPGGYA